MVPTKMVQVKVSQGLLEGEQLEVSTGDKAYYSFKGIPYAEPPIGKLRFKAPKPPHLWSGVRAATAHGPNCPQIDVFTHQLIQGSEDCLYLNVYTPDVNPQTPLPVMFFIHGGGYRSGSGDIEYYGPDYLVQHNVVLVTINYRLEAFGFLCLDTEEVPGNAGLKDQAAALRWVNENIANFGGDPRNITVFGESAGGASTMFHVLSPLSKGLFQKAISMSGVPLCEWSLSFQPRRRAFTLGKILGLDTEDSDELLEYLQSVPAEKLILTNPFILAIEEVNSNNGIKFFHFVPVVEKDFGVDHFLTERPLDILKRGAINDVDIMIGHTNEEAVIGIEWFQEKLIKIYDRYPEVIVPRDISSNSRYDTILEVSDLICKHFFGSRKISKDMREFITYANEACFLYNITRFADRLPKTGKNKIYFYQFSTYSDINYYGKAAEKYGIKGASHLDDLLYLFDAKFLNAKLDRSSTEYKAVQLFC